MSGSGEVFVGAWSVSIKGVGHPPMRRSMRGIETRWPSAAVFAGFMVYLVAYAVWLAGRPSLFIEPVEDPLCLPAIVNPLFFVASSWVRGAASLRFFDGLAGGCDSFWCPFCRRG